MTTQTKTYKFYSDPGHAWMAVKIADIKRVGLTPDDISGYSYIRGKTVYLEEDCDASAFFKAFRKTFGTDPKYTEIFHEKTAIRSYDRLHYGNCHKVFENIFADV